MQDSSRSSISSLISTRPERNWLTLGWRTPLSRNNSDWAVSFRALPRAAPGTGRTCRRGAEMGSGNTTTESRPILVRSPLNAVAYVGAQADLQHGTLPIPGTHDLHGKSPQSPQDARSLPSAANNRRWQSRRSQGVFVDPRQQSLARGQVPAYRPAHPHQTASDLLRLLSRSVRRSGP